MLQVERESSDGPKHRRSPKTAVDSSVAKKRSSVCNKSILGGLRWGWFPRSAVRLCDFRVRRESAVILDFRIRLHVNCWMLHVTEFISSRGEKGSPLQFRNRRRSHHSQHNPLRIRPRRDANGTPPPHPSYVATLRRAYADGCAATGTQSASLRPHWITHRPTAHPASHLPRRTAEEASPST
jgi:hypothetical protein